MLRSLALVQTCPGPSLARVPLTSDLGQTSSKLVSSSAEVCSRAYRLFKVKKCCLEWIPDDSRLEIIFIGTGIVELAGLETGFKSIGGVF